MPEAGDLMTAATAEAETLAPPDIPAVMEQIELAYLCIRQSAIDMAVENQRGQEASQQASELSRAGHTLKRIEDAVHAYEENEDADELRRVVNGLIDNYQAGAPTDGP